MNKGRESVSEKVMRLHGKTLPTFFIHCYEKNLSNEAIAEMLGTSSGNIRRLLKQHSIDNLNGKPSVPRYMENPLFGTKNVNQINVLSKSWI